MMNPKISNNNGVFLQIKRKEMEELERIRKEELKQKREEEKKKKKLEEEEKKKKGKNNPSSHSKFTLVPKTNI